MLKAMASFATDTIFVGLSLSSNHVDAFCMLVCILKVEGETLFRSDHKSMNVHVLLGVPVSPDDGKKLCFERPFSVLPSVSYVHTVLTYTVSHLLAGNKA